ncbi:MAG: SIR2 family protein [Proteobacteria bacterium]|nr:SIR2 family protein [Pseudomonadota bacterium]
MMTKFDFNTALYFLGAGASCDAGMPTAIQLEARIREAIKGQPLTVAIYDFVKGSIETHIKEYGYYGESRGTLDIEDIIAGIRSLSMLSKSLTLPFFSLNVEELWHIIITTHGYNKHYYERFDSPPTKVQFIENCVRQALESIHTCLIDILRTTNIEKLQYLLPLLNKGLIAPLDIFTLNFDDTIESLVDTRPELKKIFTDGFKEYTDTSMLFPSSRNIPGAFSRHHNCYIYQDNWSDSASRINLYKEHGSIDYCYIGREIIKIREKNYPPYPSLLGTPKSFQKGNYSPHVIFGKADKLRLEGLHLLHKLRESLESKNYVCVVGYSFRDSHINIHLEEWLINNKNAVLCIVTPDIRSALTSLRNGAFKLQASISATQRIFLIESTFANLTASRAFQNGIVLLKNGSKWLTIDSLQLVV